MSLFFGGRLVVLSVGPLEPPLPKHSSELINYYSREENFRWLRKILEISASRVGQEILVSGAFST